MAAVLVVTVEKRRRHTRGRFKTPTTTARSERGVACVAMTRAIHELSLLYAPEQHSRLHESRIRRAAAKALDASEPDTLQWTPCARGRRARARRGRELDEAGFARPTRKPTR